jgi:hypothetical protein
MLRTFVLLEATCEWTVGGMILTGEKRSTRRRTCHSASSSTKILHDLTWDRSRAFALKKPASFSVGDKVLQFVPHREHSALPIKRQTSLCCAGKRWLFIVRIIRNTQSFCVKTATTYTIVTRRLWMLKLFWTSVANIKLERQWNKKNISFKWF